MPTSILKHLKKLHLSCMKESIFFLPIVKKNYQELKGSSFVISSPPPWGEKYFRSSDHPPCWFQVYIYFFVWVG